MKFLVSTQGTSRIAHSGDFRLILTSRTEAKFAFDVTDNVASRRENHENGYFRSSSGQLWLVQRIRLGETFCLAERLFAELIDVEACQVLLEVTYDQPPPRTLPARIWSAHQSFQTSRDNFERYMDLNGGRSR